MKRKLYSVSYMGISGYPNTYTIGAREVIAITDMSMNGILRYEIVFKGGDLLWVYDVKEVLFKKIQDDSNERI